MAVFTEVSEQQASDLLTQLSLGELVSLEGISSGIENTNYFLTTDQGEFVLTLFERLTREQLPFYLHLMKHLADQGIAVPAPQANAQGEILLSVGANQQLLSIAWQAARNWTPALHTATPWVPAWRRCIWRHAVTSINNPICAALHGGTKPSQPYCPS